VIQRLLPLPPHSPGGRFRQPLRTCNLSMLLIPAVWTIRRQLGARFSHRRSVYPMPARFLAARVLQASRFRGDVTVFRLNARPRPRTGSHPAFRRNTAEPVYITEAAHNPEVAGSNPTPH